MAVGAADSDGDGISDAFEAMMLERLRPVVAMHSEEPLIYDPLAKVGAVGRVTPVGDGHLRVFIILGYSFDYGRCAQGGHRRDSERVAIDLVIEPKGFSVNALDSYAVAGFYTAAHEGTSTDASRISTPPEIEAIGDVTGDRCQSFHLLLFPIVNAGEPDAPMATETALGPIWSDAPFCGGIDKSDLPCATTPRGKLVDVPFVR